MENSLSDMGELPGVRTEGRGGGAGALRLCLTDSGEIVASFEIGLNRVVKVKLVAFPGLRFSTEAALGI